MLDAAAFFFGRADAPLFGWLHSPEPAQTLGLGMVICNPFGFEEVCSHRSLGHLARVAAESGVPTLRFDYAGCGNSSGSESDPDTLTRWVASIHQAVDTLKQRSGVQHVVLLGLRLGASLAALAAAERDDVLGMIAIAPVVQGRLYVRELRILAETAAGNASRLVKSQSGLESAGFLLTQEATDAIGALDLRKMTVKPTLNVLIVDRDDLSVGPQWAEALDALGANVRSVQWPGYRAMMVDPQRSVAPWEMFTGVVMELKVWDARIVKAHQSSSAIPESSQTLLPAAYVVDRLFQERVIQIDIDGGSLAGVLTMPVGRSLPTRGVLLINSGSVHSIGPNRLWVDLARNWAARGMVVLRLDLSGIGDSPPRPGSSENVVYSAEAAQDIVSALRYLREQCNVADCRVLGLCSGAYHGFKAAVNGVPLTSAVLINPLTFFWEIGKPLDEGIKDYEVVAQSSNYSRQLLSLEPWRKLLSGQLDFRYLFAFAVRRLESTARPVVEAIAHLLCIPLKEDLSRELIAATGTGSLHFIFAHGEPGIELLRSQGKRSLKSLLAQRRITIDFIPDADHTFTRLEARERLVGVLNRLMFEEGSAT